ncbi:MAG: hypothetical protein GX095_02950 [Clostridiales bacterium]|nr:hypothetical protein [Clostridiales bacterium]
MKRRTIITVLVVMMSLVILLTAFACNKKDPPKPPAPPPPPAVPEAQLSDVLEILVEGADKAIYSVANVDTAAYYQATLYLNVNDASYELAVKGTFDKNTESKNGGLVELRAKDEAGAMAPVLSVYAAGDVVYIGETFTNDKTNWVKLSQGEDGELVYTFFSKLPGLIKDALSTLGQTPLYDLAGSYIELSAMLEGMDFATLKVPSTYDIDTGKIDGDYTVSLVLSEVTGFISQLGINLTEILNGEGISDYVGIIQTIAPIILGLELKEGPEVNIDGRNVPSYSLVPMDNAPQIDIDFAISGGTLSKIGLTYSREAYTYEGESYDAITVSFGIKDFSAQNASKAATELKPSAMPEPDDVGEAAIKLSLDLAVGAKDLAATIDAYVVPDIVISYDDETGKFAIDWTGAKAYAVAKVAGTDVQIAAAKYDANEKALVFDLAGVYAKLGIQDPPADTAYKVYFDLDEFFNGGDELEQLSNAEGYTKPLDVLIDGAREALESGDIIGFITGNIGNVMDILEALIAEVVGEGKPIEADAEAKKLTIDFIAIIEALMEFEYDGETFFDSAIIADAIGNYMGEEGLIKFIVEKIAEASGKDHDDLKEIILKYSGIVIGDDMDIDEYVEENGLLLIVYGFARDAKGIGFGIELKPNAADASYAKVELALKIVTVDAAEQVGDDIDIDIDDALDLDEAWDDFVAEMERILDAYKAYPNAA